jgi:predicted Zn-dependent protease
MLLKKQYKDVLPFSTQLINHCTDSFKMVAYRLEAMVGCGKIGEAIEYTTKCQSQYIEHADFMYWCGKLMIYNSNVEKGRQYLREALNKDPDNVTYQKAWRNLQKLEKTKKEGTDFFSAG